ncbi:hypothetical protein HT136_10420 [Novosphingobium profundi]|uniref:hypothetical protein n=1 Tax=Novosphingobium profundi TaxID=1774954 RepID=UPI001FE48141|nr:hypothetical protein [Novosphingobium profundi]MBT0668779.1 hypothetical protein [Novosphingobium profundi]
MSGPENTRGNPAGPADSGAKSLTREERLAAKLRENLRRRKAQARAFDAPSPPRESGESGESHEVGADSESDRLPKSPPES